jgi:hypothetical protein
MLVPKRQTINTSLFYKPGCLIVWQVKTKSTITSIATLPFRLKQRGNFFLRLIQSHDIKIFVEWRYISYNS